MFSAFQKLTDESALNAKIGSIGGFPIQFTGMALTVSRNYVAVVSLEMPGATPLLSFPIDPDTAVNGIAARAVNQINGLERQRDKARDDITINKAMVSQIEKRTGAAFPEESILMEKLAELSALQDELSRESQEANADAAAATVAAEGEQTAAAAAVEDGRKFSLAPPPPSVIPSRAGNLQRGQEAMSRLLSSRSPETIPQWNAMHRGGVGWISFVWEAGPRGELGLAHLIEGRADIAKTRVMAIRSCTAAR